MGNWDEVVRTGGWDVGSSPPMALGVEAAGIVAATFATVSALALWSAIMGIAAP